MDDERLVEVSDADGIWVGNTWQTVVGWTAHAVDGGEVRDHDGWNGDAYDTREQAEDALRAHGTEQRKDEK